MNNLQVLQEVKKVLNKSVCPKCMKPLKEAVISGESDMYGNNVRYIGCTNCGHTSIYNNDVKAVLPLMAKSNNTKELLTQDINKAFAKDCISSSSLGLSIDEPKKSDDEHVTEFLKELLKHLPEHGERPIVFGKANAKENEKQAIDGILNGIKSTLESIPGAKVTIIDKTKEDEECPEVEVKPVMGCRMGVTTTTPENTKVEKISEKRDSYLIIDEYGDNHVYKNVTRKELLNLIEEYHNINDDLEIYKLTSMNYTVKKEIYID